MNFPTTLLRLLLGKRDPITSGNLTVPGLHSPITIRRDSYGVPYITAENAADAWYGLGFCHGQDRAFQLETMLRLVRGTLAEIAGAGALPMDRLSRRIGFHRYAAGHLAIMPQEQIDIVRAYTHGINTGATTGSPKTAHEFTLLKIDPTPWDANDVLAVMNYMGIHLSGWTAKLTRLFILTHDGPEALAALDADYPEWMLASAPVGKQAGPAVDRLLQDAEALLAHIGAGASNNWAIAGANTRSGRPILANDPHLAPVIPSQWYLAGVEYPDLKVAGASFVGLPLIPSGFNGTAAWGVTAGLVDGIDIYVEDLDPETGYVRTGADFHPAQKITETYTVKDADEAFTEDILLTPRGPVVSDLFEGLDHTLSMKATWMIPRPVDGITNFHRSTSFQNCRENFEHLYVVSMNVAYADTHGSIGWQLVGEAPVRKKGWGALPMAGWDPEADWGEDLVPLFEMPWTMDPESGYLATANNMPTPDGSGPYLGRDFVPYRHGRIMELLGKRTDWDLAGVQKLQLDRFSIPWREIREFVLAATPADPAAAAAYQLLDGWDGVLAADSRGGAVYEFFMIALAHRLAAAKAPHSTERALGKGFSNLFRGSSFFIRHPTLVTRLLQTEPEGWFDEGWDAVIEDALRTAHAQLTERLGPDSGKWRWGDVHTLVLRHTLSVRKPLNRIFDRGPYPTGGDHDTVAQAGRLTTVYGSNVVSMANLRMGVEVGDWDNNFFIIAGGQSGNPTSKHYDDQLKLWLSGEAIDVAWSEQEIMRRVESTLNLQPE